MTTLHIIGNGFDLHHGIASLYSNFQEYAWRHSGLDGYWIGLLETCYPTRNKENGHRRSVQMYSCKDCGRQFQGGLRINNISLWNDYLTANRTISDLSTLYKCSERTIRRRLSLVVDSFTATYPKSAVIILDTTYFSKTFGVMLFQDASSGKILYRKFVKNETNRDYLDGLQYIAEHGTMIKAVVCDGHMGLLQAITTVPLKRNNSSLN